MPASIACAKAGVTTGEWGFALRESVRRVPRADRRRPRAAQRDRGPRRRARRRRPRVAQARPAAEIPGRQARPRRPFQRRRADRGARARRRHGGGLRGHPPDPGRDRRSGAREGRARGRAVDPVRLARAAGDRTWSRACKSAGLDDVPVVVGGIIPPEDAQALQQAGVAAVYTPKDFELNRIMADIVRIVDRNRGVARCGCCRRRSRAESSAALRDCNAVRNEQSFQSPRAPPGARLSAAGASRATPARLDSLRRRRERDARSRPSPPLDGRVVSSGGSDEETHSRRHQHGRARRRAAARRSRRPAGGVPRAAKLCDLHLDRFLFRRPWRRRLGPQGRDHRAVRRSAAPSSGRRGPLSTSAAGSPAARSAPTTRPAPGSSVSRRTPAGRISPATPRARAASSGSRRTAARRWTRSAPLPAGWASRSIASCSTARAAPPSPTTSTNSTRSPRTEPTRPAGAGWRARGIEYSFTDNWSAKFEYNYLDFGTRAVRFTDTTGLFPRYQHPRAHPRRQSRHQLSLRLGAGRRHLLTRRDHAHASGGTTDPSTRVSALGLSGLAR